MLTAIERIGNKMPDPAIIFLALIASVILLSQVLDWAGVHATYQVDRQRPAISEPVYQGGSSDIVEAGPTEPPGPGSYRIVTETSSVKGLLTVDGVRYIFTSFVDNFRNFAALAIILVVMIGVGLAEASGLIAALIRKLVGVSSKSTLTFIIILLGMLSSVASDAGYLVLIPLGAAAFMSVGRNPIAGIAAAFAGVSAGFGVNFLITPLDGVLVGITNDAANFADPADKIDLVSNLYFGIASTLFVTIIATAVTTRIVEKVLGDYDPALAPTAGGDGEVEPAVAEVAPEAESRGLAWAGWGTLAAIAFIVLLTAPPGAPLRDPVTDKVIGDSPFMDSLIVIIMFVFLVAGLCYGRGAGTLTTKDQVLATITKSWAGLAALLFLFLLIAQFIACFNFSKMPDVAAVKLGDVLEHIDVGAVWLLLGVVIISAIINFIIPAAIAKWALLAPIFIPLFLRLGVPPQTVLAAYRVGDAPTNVVTPLMAYFPLIVVFTKRYDKNSGIGTVVSMMLPYVIALSILWTLFFLAWYLLGIPLGPGAPVS
ncbi:AbgT family transporter [Baekduia alba]|uniref:AbgT family transporter n=1 Tax=Baekduia alba TaxID=2997333 RepID=UPI00233FA57D|nr:AbgT family transporter [Baekduia alba]